MIFIAKLAIIRSFGFYVWFFYACVKNNTKGIFPYAYYSIMPGRDAGAGI